MRKWKLLFVGMLCFLMVTIVAACSSKTHEDQGFTSSTSSNISSNQLPIDITLPIPGLQPGDLLQPELPSQSPDQTAPRPGVPSMDRSPDQSVDAGTIAVEARVIELTNIERRNQGLPDLQADSSLSDVAREKSNDMQQNNYFSHTSPTYGSPFDMMRDMGVSYTSAGENIAMGQQSPEEVVAAWMNSEGHRENILRTDYTHIGVGYISNGSYWTQMFIRK